MIVRSFAWLFALSIGTLASLAPGAAQNVPPTPPPVVPGGGTPGTTVPLPIPITAPSAVATPPASPSPRRTRPPASSTPAPDVSPSETPAPPQFTSLDGTWEVELQTRTKTYYSHFTLKQSGQGGAEISGVWDRDKRKLPLTGTFDGRLFKFVIKDDTKEYTMSGYAENFSDIVGLYKDGTKQMPFTAEHRKRDRGLDVGPGVPGLPGGVPRR